MRGIGRLDAFSLSRRANPNERHIRALPRCSIYLPQEDDLLSSQPGSLPSSVTVLLSAAPVGEKA